MLTGQDLAAGTSDAAYVRDVRFMFHVLLKLMIRAALRELAQGREEQCEIDLTAEPVCQ